MNPRVFPEVWAAPSQPSCCSKALNLELERWVLLRVSGTISLNSQGDGLGVAQQSRSLCLSAAGRGAGEVEGLVEVLRWSRPRQPPWPGPQQVQGHPLVPSKCTCSQRPTSWTLTEVSCGHGRGSVGVEHLPHSAESAASSLPRP